MQIFYRSIEGRTKCITVDPSESIRSVKRKIEYKEGIPIKYQRLTYSHYNLLDDETIQDYNIKNNYTIRLYCKWVRPET